MLLGELLSRPVECEGTLQGVVVDARFVLRGPVGSGALTAPELVGLVVGPRDGAAFLGYERRSLRRPALLNRFFARRQRDSFLVDLADVESVGDRVVLRPGFTRWSVALPDQE